MLKARAAAALLTLLLHLAILFALLRVTTRVVEPPPPQPALETSVHALRDAGERIVSVDIVPALSTRGLACPGSNYVGVGITADPRTERIILVGDNTPASRGGLQHDDIVLNPDVWRDAQQEGALLHILVLREGVKMIVSVRVGRICIE